VAKQKQYANQREKFIKRNNQINRTGRGQHAGCHRTFKRRGSRLDYHERFSGTLESGDGQNGLRRRQSERRDDCD